ncbi:MAG TPA: transcriptional regulator [Ktedonobacterales bacterium]|jgi:predicted DNA-binding transcriptional regulator YafY
MRADRLLSMLLLLQANRRVTAQKLAEKLEVSERTIYRDLEALSAAGIPVYAERGPGGGCTLLGEYRTTLTGLNESDVRTLLLSGVPRPLADLGLDKALEVALLKLLAALPSARRPDAEGARQRLHLDAAAWSAPEVEEVPHLRILQEAVWQERKVRLSYRTRSRVVNERLVEPLGLVAKTHVWYLVSRIAGEMRVYRLSRMQSVELTDETFERPDDFDLAAYWVDWCARLRATFTHYPAVLRLAPEAMPILPHFFGEGAHALLDQGGPPDADGWVTLHPTFETIEEACSMALGLGDWVEVLEPAELRERVIRQAASVVAFYAQR